MKQQWMTGTILMLAATTGLAADATVRYDAADDRDRTVVVERDTNRDWMGYKANELDFSFFGTGTVGKKTLHAPSTRRIERDGKLGLGAGISYFFCRYVGVEGYAYSESTADYFVDDVGGNLIGRFPIGHSGVALYGFGGGSRQFDPVIQWTLDAGGGIEWRFSKHVGIFTDARYVWADETKNYALGRLGVRVGF